MKKQFTEGQIIGFLKEAEADNALEFCGRTMLTWAHERGVTLRLIEPGKPNQNAYIESFKRAVPRRMSQRALVHESGPCTSGYRGLAPRVQRGATEEKVGWAREYRDAHVERRTGRHGAG